MISWTNVAQAIRHYEMMGFEYMEVPWIVSPSALGVTLPPGRIGLRTMFGDLVGSAEQSFIQLMQDGTMPEGEHMAASPCFRDDQLDVEHQRYFFKVELINAWKHQFDTEDQLKQMLNVATNFFRSLPGGELTRVVATPDGYDLTLNNVEVGSYGVRRFNEWTWVYGTGYADPRFGYAASLGKTSCPG